jgi:hypothetical protein
VCVQHNLLGVTQADAITSKHLFVRLFSDFSSLTVFHPELIDDQATQVDVAAVDTDHLQTTKETNTSRCPGQG